MTTHHARTAGIGGVLTFTVWLLQPLAVFWLLGDEELLTWASLERVRWIAPYETVTFSLIALGMFLLVHGIDRQLGGREDESAWSAAGRMAGYTSVLGWLLLVVTGSALFSSASSDLEAMAVADQTSALAIHGVVSMAALHLAVLGAAGWLVLVGTRARSRGVVGRPTATVALVAAALALAPFAVPFSPPWGTLVVLAMCLWLGVQQLRASRRTIPTPVAAPVTQGV